MLGIAYSLIKFKGKFVFSTSKLKTTSQFITIFYKATYLYFKDISTKDERSQSETEVFLKKVWHLERKGDTFKVS